MGQLLPTLPARVLRRATTPGPAGRGGGAGCGLGAVGAAWGHPRHSALGEKGAMGCARTRPRALNRSWSLFGLFTHFLFLHPSTLPCPAASRRLFPSKGKQDNFPLGTTAIGSHSPTPLHNIPKTFPFSILLLPSPWPPRLPAGQPPFPATTLGHQPQTTGCRPHALPRATSGWWDGAGAKGTQETPKSRANVAAYKYSSKLSAVYPDPLFWRWVLAEQTPGSAAG